MNNDTEEIKPISKTRQLKLDREKRKKERKLVLKRKKENIYRKKVRLKRKREKLKQEKLELKKSIPRKKNPKFSWRLIITSQKRKLTDIMYISDRDNAIESFNKILLENNKEVRFPIKYSSRDHKLVESDYELLLLKRRDEYDSDISLLRNEIGTFTKNKSNSEKWLIYLKDKFLMEESFWVYGFNPTHDRKDFNYILNEILLRDLPRVKYPVKKMVVYNNKLIIEDDFDFDIIICKNSNDSVRLYNELEKELINRKIKSVFLVGMISTFSKKTLIDRIMVKTGWNRIKVKRTSTRP